MRTSRPEDGQFPRRDCGKCVAVTREAVTAADDGLHWLWKYEKIVKLPLNQHFWKGTRETTGLPAAGVD